MSKLYPNMWPGDKLFIDLMKTMGVKLSTRVALYDQNGLGASRAFYLFSYFGHNKVSLLNGGLRKWVSEGKKLDS